MRSLRPLVLGPLLVVAACGGSGDDDTADAAGGGGGDSAAGVDAAAPTVDGAVAANECPAQFDAPCGGDLTGTWQIVGLCPDDPAAAAALFEHPFSDLPACADREANRVDGVLVHTGSVTIDATSVQLDFTEAAQVTWGFTTDCLRAIDGEAAPADACAALGGRATCVFAGGVCTCDALVEGKPSMGTLPLVAVDTDTVTIDGLTVDYCAGVDSLVLDWAEHPVSWRYWVFTR